MLNHKLFYTACSIVLFGLLATSSARAVSNPRRTHFLTFDGTVSMPGVSLPAGTYQFELADPENGSTLVRVSSRDGRHLYWMGFTHPVQRPSGMDETQHIVFGEAPVSTT